MIEKNTLSAFFDGEKNCNSVEDEQWFDSLAKDEDNLQAWRSYSLTRDVMRGDSEQDVGWDISAKVAQALDMEPAYQKQSNNHAASENVVAMQQAQPSAKEAKKTIPFWLKQLTQVGTAAAISLVVILGVQQYNASDDTALNSVIEQPPVLQTIPVSGTATPVSLNREATNKQDEEIIIEQRRRINEIFQDFELQQRLNAIDSEKK